MTSAEYLVYDNKDSYKGSGKMEKASLILEGGTFRTIYTSGILDTFLKEDIMMPYILGISAGAINLCSYISKQPERTMRVFTQYRHDKRYIGLRNFLTERSLFGLDFGWNVLPNELELFDWDTFKSYEGQAYAGVTNALTGEVEFLDVKDMDLECQLLRATCAIPIMFPEIKLNGTPYYDGGLADPIPIHHAVEEGYDKHVIVLTRPKGYYKRMDRQTKTAIQLLRKKYPALVDVMLKRVDRYNETVAYCERLEAEGKAFIYRPPYAIEGMEKDVAKMRANYRLGLHEANARMHDLKSFLNI